MGQAWTAQVCTFKVKQLKELREEMIVNVL